MFDFLQMTLSGREPQEHSGSNFNLRWQWQAQGVLELEPLHGYRKSVVLSAGIHGNETAPIELLAALVSDLLHGKRRLQVRLLVIFGNPAAMVSGERYNQIDLNRLFSGRYAQFPACAETARAEQLEQLARDFYDQSNESERLHFDLHTAIRESHHQRFGLLPHTDGLYSRQMLDWLHHSGIEALVINQAPSGTFSYFTSQHCQAQSCTLELGKAQPFGQNDLNQFALISQGLISLITGINMLPHAAEPIKVYRVTQELKKISEQFQLNFPESVKNFTRFSAGDLLARDGEISYQVQQSEEWVLFPNASVRPGLRAGLMLVQVPSGIPCSSADEAVAATKKLGGDKWVVKCQVHAGGRGKAGGVKVASSEQDVRAIDILELFQNVPQTEAIVMITNKNKKGYVDNPL